MTRCLFRRDMAIAYNATTVLPADVWADTYQITDYITYSNLKINQTRVEMYKNDWVMIFTWKLSVLVIISSFILL